MAYGDFKELTWRTVSDKILRDKVFIIAKNRKYDEYQRGLASVVYKYFEKKNLVGDIQKVRSLKTSIFLTPCSLVRSCSFYKYNPLNVRLL